MIYYCSNCWNAIRKNAKQCPFCGVSVKILDDEEGVSKLINDLNHPVGAIATRVATIIGHLQLEEALPALKMTAQQSQDPYFIAAAVEAVGQFGDAGNLSFFEIFTHSNSIVVRLAAKDAIKKCAISIQSL